MRSASVRGTPRCLRRSISMCIPLMAPRGPPYVRAGAGHALLPPTLEFDADEVGGNKGVVLSWEGAREEVQC